MRKASLGTLFLTVFLDLLGFGLVVPFLPGVARDLGASDFLAAALGAAYSLAQFVCIPLWGRLSDRIGRRPVLLVSIAATVVGMALLGLANSLVLLFVARLFSGAATANIAVAQAYIADITPPEGRARGMGMIGMGFGLGFIFGPFLGGVLGHVEMFGRQGSLAAFVAAGLSVLNLVLAWRLLPESLPASQRDQPGRKATPLDLTALRMTARLPGLRPAMLLGFSVIFWFSGMEQTFRLFTEDAFGMTVAGTGYVFGFVGVVAVIVQGGLIHRLTRRFGEVRLLAAGAVSLAAGFALMAVSPACGAWGKLVLTMAAGVIAMGSGLHTPSLSSYTSRQAAGAGQGFTLGVVQSIGALARVLGPLAGGIAYQSLGMRAPYWLGAIGMMMAFVVALQLPPIVVAPRASDI